MHFKKEANVPNINVDDASISPDTRTMDNNVYDTSALKSNAKQR